MTFYDSSVLIEYLDGDERVVRYVDSSETERAVATPLVLFEVYQGEVFKTGPAEFDSIDAALGWLTIVDEPAELAREAAQLQNRLAEVGAPLAARDAYIAGAASGLGETLVATDPDFDIDELREHLELEIL